MEAALTILALAAVVVAGTALARRLDVSAPLLLTGLGILLSFVPSIPDLEVGPEIILLGVLPPLLYAAAIRTSLVDLGANKASIGLLSVGLVIFTALGVAFVAWRFFDLPLAVALAMGGIVAPTDAVSATAVARRFGLPKRIVTILEGESLFNDATALTIVRSSILAIAGAVGAFEVGVEFLRATVGGILVGLVVAVLLNLVRERVSDVRTDTALSLMAAWLAYLPAELIHSSGVLATVVCGIILGHKAPVALSAQARTSERVNWSTLQFLLENGVFLVIGLQAHLIVERAAESSYGLGESVALSVAVLVTVVLLRPLWLALFGALIVVTPGVRRDRFYLSQLVVTSWAGMRGVVTLAAAFLLPEGTPARDAVILTALVVTVGTLVIQGLSLPWLASALGVRGPDPREDALQAANVLTRAVQKGNEALDSYVTPDTPEEIVDQLRTAGTRTTNLAWEQLGQSSSGVHSPTVVYQKLRKKMLRAQREEVLRIRDAGTVDQDVLQEVLASIDLEESMIAGLGVREARDDDRVITTRESQRGECEHLLDAPEFAEPSSPSGCLDCLREGLTWVHLRLCLTCGNVGCCDSSVGLHATKHFHDTQHPVMRSFEPGEAWRWCYVDELLG